MKPSLIWATLGSSNTESILFPRKGHSLVKMNWKEEFTAWADKQVFESRPLSPLQFVLQHFSPIRLKNFAFRAIASCDFSWNNPGWLWLKVILGEPLEVVANEIKCAQWLLLQAMFPSAQGFYGKTRMCYLCSKYLSCTKPHLCGALRTGDKKKRILKIEKENSHWVSFEIWITKQHRIHFLVYFHPPLGMNDD